MESLIWDHVAILVPLPIRCHRIAAPPTSDPPRDPKPGTNNGTTPLSGVLLSHPWGAPQHPISAIPAISSSDLAIAGGRRPPGKPLVAETLVVGWRCAKKPFSAL